MEWVKKECLDPFTLRRLKNSYGHLCKQEWMVKNWGIMSNCANVSHTVDEVPLLQDQCDLKYKFDTVWSEPQLIFNALWNYIATFDTKDNIEFQWYFEDSCQEYSGYMSYEYLDSDQ